MSNMLIPKNKSNEELEFIIYNIVFSQKCGKFTTDFVSKKLENHKIEIEKRKLETLFERWADCGLIFEGANEYIINSIID